MKIKKIISRVSLFVLTFLFVFNTAQAADFRVATDKNGNINIGKEEQIKNLYTAGNIVSVDAEIEKSLHVAGNIVNVNGNVGHSLSSAAGTLITKGYVGGSLQGAGGNILIDSKIKDDLIIVGGNIFISDQSSIGEDMVIAGGTIDFQGLVGGNVYIAGGILTINGEINGDVKIDQVDELKIGKNAVIKGNLEYVSKKDIEIEEGSVILGEIINNKDKKGVKDLDKAAFVGLIFAFMSLTILIKVIGLTVIGLILVLIFKNITQKITDESYNNFWKSLLTGFILLILVPATVIILIMTVVGIWLAMLIMVLYCLFLMFSVSFMTISLGSWVMKIIKKRKSYVINWKVVVSGVITFLILDFIPFVGWFIIFLFMIISLGSMYRVFMKMYK